MNSGIKSERDLWNASMNGQYPASGSGPYMAAWFEFMSGNRFWELEPYFDVDGGRAIALEGVEYIVYVEKPGPVEVTLEKHGYDVAWINPATGERIKQKGYNGEHFTGEAPDASHDWVLHISREGHKEGMLKSYKFESRAVPVQEVELSAQRIPFEVSSPSVNDLSISSPPYFALKIKRDTRATRSLLVEWTGEGGHRRRGLPGDRQRPRRHDADSALDREEFPRRSQRCWVAALNANGKAYVLDKVYRLNP